MGRLAGERQSREGTLPSSSLIVVVSQTSAPVGESQLGLSGAGARTVVWVLVNHGIVT